MLAHPHNLVLQDCHECGFKLFHKNTTNSSKFQENFEGFQDYRPKSLENLRNFLSARGGFSRIISPRNLSDYLLPHLTK